MGGLTECDWYFYLYTLPRADLKYYIVKCFLDNFFHNPRPLDLFVFPCTIEQSAYNVHKIGVATPTTCASRITSPRIVSCSIKLPCILFYQQPFIQYFV